MSEQVSGERDAANGLALPGLIARVIVAVGLACATAVLAIGRLDDPPFPLDDPAIRNLVVLSSCFAAGFALWLWFCFRSSFSRRLRLATAVGTALSAVLFASVITT